MGNGTSGDIVRLWLGAPFICDVDIHAGRVILKLAAEVVGVNFRSREPVPYPVQGIGLCLLRHHLVA